MEHLLYANGNDRSMDIQYASIQCAGTSSLLVASMPMGAAIEGLEIVETAAPIMMMLARLVQPAWTAL